MKKAVVLLTMAFALVAIWLGTGCEKPAMELPKGIALVGNSVCPVSEKPVGGSAQNPHFYSDFKGYRVGFMCPVCKGIFDKADEEQKQAFVNKALASVKKGPAS